MKREPSSSSSQWEFVFSLAKQQDTENPFIKSERVVPQVRSQVLWAAATSVTVTGCGETQKYETCLFDAENAAQTPRELVLSPGLGKGLWCLFLSLTDLVSKDLSLQIQRKMCGVRLRKHSPRTL